MRTTNTPGQSKVASIMLPFARLVSGVAAGYFAANRLLPDLSATVQREGAALVELTGQPTAKILFAIATAAIVEIGAKVIGAGVRGAVNLVQKGTEKIYRGEATRIDEARHSAEQAATEALQLALTRLQVQLGQRLPGMPVEPAPAGDQNIVPISRYPKRQRKQPTYYAQEQYAVEQQIKKERKNKRSMSHA